MYKLITAATLDPVTVTELKSQLRITTTSQDTMLGLLIKAATQHVEDYLRYSIMPSTWDLYLDSFNSDIWIQKIPVSAITHVKYINSEGVLTTLTVDVDYVIDIDSKPARIYTAYSKSWPSTRSIYNCVVVRFVAGYASSADVPERLKQAILMLAASLYENPSDEVTGTQVNKIHTNSERFLRPLRAMRY